MLEGRKKPHLGIIGLALLLFFVMIGGCRRQEFEGQRTIRFTTWGSPASNRLYQDVVEEFEKRNPEIRVDLRTLPWSHYHRKILTMAAAGSKLGDFYPEALMGCEAEGHLYGLPLDIPGWAVYYNRGMFDRAGLPYPEESWTWETFLDISRKLTQDLNGDGILDQYGAYIKVKMAVIELLAGQSGAMILNQDLFAMEKVAMVLLTRGEVTGFRRNLAFDWDVASVPRWVQRDPSALIVGGFNPWVIARTTELPEDSWRFLKFFTGQEAATKMARTGRIVPARRSVAESPAFLKTTPPENNGAFLDLIRTPKKVFVPRFQRYSRLGKVFEDSIQLLIEGRLTVEECAAKIAREVDQLIEEVRAEQQEMAPETVGRIEMPFSTG
jgi:multiple sugar transport system substrate-binding protein